MNNLKIPIYQPCLHGREKEYVNDCIDSNWISAKGKYIDLFEKRFAEYIGVNYAAAVCNGTVALHLALLALSVGEGDEVIVPTLTYIASVNAVKYCNATPVFIDSLRDTWQMDPAELEKKITGKTKAIIVVHLYGYSCDMGAIVKICNKHSIPIIEDCAEALGSEYFEKKIGTFGTIATFSFYGNKTITTGEGGMVVSDNPELITTVRKLKGQGLAENREYWHDIVGYNYRMTNICAAIGLAQLEQIDQIVSSKAQIAKWYMQMIKTDHLIFCPVDKNIFNSYWMFSLLVKKEKHRESLRKFLAKDGVETRPFFYPIHTMKMYNAHERYPVAENIAARGINLPSFPDLTKEQVKFISDRINMYFKNEGI